MRLSMDRLRGILRLLTVAKPQDFVLDARGKALTLSVSFVTETVVLETEQDDDPSEDDFFCVRTSPLLGKILSRWVAPDCVLFVRNGLLHVQTPDDTTSCRLEAVSASPREIPSASDTDPTGFLPNQHLLPTILSAVDRIQGALAGSLRKRVQVGVLFDQGFIKLASASSHYMILGQHRFSDLIEDQVWTGMPLSLATMLKRSGDDFTLSLRQSRWYCKGASSGLVLYGHAAVEDWFSPHKICDGARLDTPYVSLNVPHLQLQKALRLHVPFVPTKGSYKQAVSWRYHPDAVTLESNNDSLKIKNTIPASESEGVFPPFETCYMNINALSLARLLALKSKQICIRFPGKSTSPILFETDSWSFLIMPFNQY